MNKNVIVYFMGHVLKKMKNKIIIIEKKKEIEKETNIIFVIEM